MSLRTTRKDAGNRRRIGRQAAGLAALAVAFYFGFIAWSALHGLA